MTDLGKFFRILALASALPLGLLHSSEEGPRCMPAFPGQKKVNWTEFMLTTNKTKGEKSP